MDNPEAPDPWVSVYRARFTLRTWLEKDSASRVLIEHAFNLLEEACRMKDGEDA